MPLDAKQWVGEDADPEAQGSWRQEVSNFLATKMPLPNTAESFPTYLARLASFVAELGIHEEPPHANSGQHFPNTLINWALDYTLARRGLSVSPDGTGWSWCMAMARSLVSFAYDQFNLTYLDDRLPMTAYCPDMLGYATANGLVGSAHVGCLALVKGDGTVVHVVILVADLGNGWWRTAEGNESDSDRFGKRHESTFYAVRLPC